MFQKGFDPNRNNKGRPSVANSVATLAREVLQAKKKGEKRTTEEKILNKFVQMALEGSAPHANFLFDRAYGKAIESMNLSGGLSLYEQGANEQTFDKNFLLGAMRRLSGSKK